MLGVYTLKEFKKQIKHERNELKYVIAFPEILFKLDKGDIFITFTLEDDEYFVLRDSIQNQGEDTERTVMLFYESYLQRMCEILLRSES